MRDIPSYEILNTCVKCGLCLPTCPTYRLTLREQSSPRGRIHLMQAVSESRLSVLDATFVDQMYECLDCRACEAVCPSGVRYGEVIEAARAQVEHARVASRRRGIAETLLRRAVFEGVLANMSLLRSLAALLRFYQCGGLRTAVRRLGLLRLLHLERLERQAPELGARFFVPRDQRFPAEGERRGRAALHAGCVMHVAFAEIDRATIRVLTRNGWEVIVPASQGCCGALHVHAGEAAGGRARARANIAAFEAAEVDVVVSNAAGCGAALKEYGVLLQDEPAWAERAAAFSARVRDLTELLASAPMRGDLKSLNRTVTYQDPCHLAHAQRVAAAPRALLRQIPGLELVEMQETALCCGSAGIYNLTHPEMSARLLAGRVTQVLETGADIVATANPGCMLQLRNGLLSSRPPAGKPIGVRHVVELLDSAYGGGSPLPGASAPSPFGRELG
ncbi:MAG TPA: (Fe-S)-binding protein [Dehalococcoidia bacterium]|nr:(Fe-S)-binding protein [Dehalococcoidia bacterium]